MDDLNDLLKIKCTFTGKDLCCTVILCWAGGQDQVHRSQVQSVSVPWCLFPSGLLIILVMFLTNGAQESKS